MFTLEEAYKAAQGRKEFVVKETTDTICFDYVIITDDSFNDPQYGWIRRNFRGITFCKNTGKLLSLPFHKFYNVDQNEESQFHLHQHKKASIYEKLDGSMIHFYMKNENELVASTCRSPENIQSNDALRFAKSDANLLSNILNTIENNLTPIFEWVAPHNQIVCYYEQPRLVYLSSRDKKSGQYVFENNYADKAAKIDIQFCDIVKHKKIKNMEGFVCHLECGTLLKVKTEWYLERHHAVDLLTRPKYKAYEIALNNLIDDVIGLAGVSYRDILRDIKKEVDDDIINSRRVLENIYKDLYKQVENDDPESRRKKFVSLCRDNYNFPALIAIFSGKDPDKFIRKQLLEHYSKKYPERIMKNDI